MVTARLLLLIIGLVLIPGAVFCQDMKVNASIDDSKVLAGRKAKGTITISHDENDKVDINSFRMGNVPLKVDLVQETRVRPGNSLLISIYSFVMDPGPKGLQLLPEIRVKVGGKEALSAPSTYEVTEMGGEETAKGKAFLGLEAVIDGPSVLYPTQRVRFLYRYTFNDNIELTREVLPMLEAPGFRKIGEKDIRSFDKGPISIQEITQEVEAIAPGVYSYGPSIIEGYVYRQDTVGGREYFKPKLLGEAPAISVTVLPFPAEGKPASFNGAVGKFTAFSMKLLSPASVRVGDQLSLQIDITGSGHLENVPLPSLCCQPGYSGIFSVSDLPPAGVVKGSTLSFVAQLRPLTDAVKAIPSLEFSWFDPDAKTYKRLQSEPIPIQVKAAASEALAPPPSPPPAAPQREQPSFSSKTQAIEIEGVMQLSMSDLYDLPLGNWWALLWIPFGTAAFLLQVGWKKLLSEEKQEEKAIKSEEIYSQWRESQLDSAEFYRLIQQMFLMRLAERGVIGEEKLGKTSFQSLPKDGIAGEVRNFLNRVDEMRYSGRGGSLGQEILDEAEQLFYRI
jgi:hypothetical protein